MTKQFCFEIYPDPTSKDPSAYVLKEDGDVLGYARGPMSLSILGAFIKYQNTWNPNDRKLDNEGAIKTALQYIKE